MQKNGLSRLKFSRPFCLFLELRLSYNVDVGTKLKVFSSSTTLSYHVCHLSRAISTKMSKMHCHHLKFLVALLNSTDRFVRFSRVLLIVQGRYWYRMKGFFELYNNYLGCFWSMYYRFEPNRKKRIGAPKMLAVVLFFCQSSAGPKTSRLVPN